jgi:hypothetical protein
MLARIQTQCRCCLKAPTARQGRQLAGAWVAESTLHPLSLRGGWCRRG